MPTRVGMKATAENGQLMSVLFQRMHIYCFKAKEITLTLLLAFSIRVCDKADKMAADIDN